MDERLNPPPADPILDRLAEIRQAVHDRDGGGGAPGTGPPLGAPAQYPGPAHSGANGRKRKRTRRGGKRARAKRERAREREARLDPLSRGREPWDPDKFPWTVRPAWFSAQPGQGDWPALVAHYQELRGISEAAGGVGRDWPEDWEILREDALETAWFVAEAIDNRFLGIVGVKRLEIGFGPIALITSWYVQPEAVKRVRSKVAEKLVETAETWARQQGLTIITGALMLGRGGKVIRGNRALRRRGYRPLGVNVVKDLEPWPK